MTDFFQVHDHANSPTFRTEVTSESSGDSDVVSKQNITAAYHYLMHS
jgi:hypothetical protein